MAKNEIEDLQTNTAKLNTPNNFGNDSTGANLIGNSEKHYAGGTVVVKMLVLLMVTPNIYNWW